MAKPKALSFVGFISSGGGICVGLRVWSWSVLQGVGLCRAYSIFTFSG